MQNTDSPLDLLPSHDAYFRAIFSDVTHAQQLLELFLPEALVQEMDLSQLQRIEDTFPGNRGGEIRADLVFVCPLRESDDSVEIVVIAEHKSYRDNRFKEQLLHEWLHVRESRRRIPIIPILFYHGPRPWQPRTFQDEARKLAHAVQILQPSVPFIFIDLCRHEDQELANLKLSGITKIALYLLKNIPARTLNIGVLYGLVSSAASSSKSTYFEETMIYLERGYLEPADLDRIEKAAKPEVSMAYKTTFEQRCDLADAKGMERGMERGMELEKLDVIRNLLAKGCDWAFIESITHLNQTGYEALKAKYADNP